MYGYTVRLAICTKRQTGRPRHPYFQRTRSKKLEAAKEARIQKRLESIDRLDSNQISTTAAKLI